MESSALDINIFRELTDCQIEELHNMEISTNDPIPQNITVHNRGNHTGKHTGASHKYIGHG